MPNGPESSGLSSQSTNTQELFSAIRELLTPIGHESDQCLTRVEYRRACLRRSPTFRKDLLGFHQKFPPVWVESPSEADSDSSAIGRSPLSLPKWLEPFLIKRASNVYEGRPETLEGLEHLQSMSAQIIAAQQRWRILHPWDGEEYFTATELDQTDYLMELRGLEHRWHDVAPHVFTSGQVCDGERSQLLVPSLPFDEKEWENRVSNVSKAAKIMIPVYAYTVAEDIDWALIKRLKVEYYGKTVPRTHDKVLATRLKAWDLYQHLRSFVEVAKQTSLPVSTVKHHYLVACRDIIGKVPAGTTKRRRIFAFDPETHVKECTRCRTEEQLCPAAEAFASQDYKALDEMLGTRDDRRQ